MADSSSSPLQNPNSSFPPPPPPPLSLVSPKNSIEDLQIPPPLPPPNPNFSLPIPAIRVTSEFDSDSSVFFHKISCKFFDRLAKFKLSFQNRRDGKISDAQLGFISKYLSVLYDLEERNALLKGSFDVGPRLQFRAVHDVKAKQGELAMVANHADSYKLELASDVPSTVLPRATLRFPLGEVTLQEKDEEAKRILSINGIVKGQLLNGVCTACYSDNDLNLRYSYKDEHLSFIPSISLPSNVASFAFKRRFSPSDKLSYWYHFNSSDWSTVYKHTVGKDLKFKAGYDSEVRLGWASLWLGEEGGKAKEAPMKMKVQFMLQVPQDDIASSVFLFRVKKRWDLF
eukprot:TRINITY_DN2526_c2_g1_i4.p1 TRINITY_DN2526_c2_g1~~TRINITY_DN2526_c2_g1_i4.p1  ORF type:complete len:379 (+),score=67.78 TRINITY_DN2526_c2_g1_i4:113-1138(+)